jgi:hypothetical protein
MPVHRAEMVTRLQWLTIRKFALLITPMTFVADGTRQGTLRIIKRCVGCEA